jgi:flagellar protein FlaG
MAIQINPMGSAPVLSAGLSPAPVAARPAPSRIQSAPAPSPGSQDAAVAQVNQHLQQTQTELKLQVDAGSGRTVFQVVQQGTGEVVLQVPSAEVLGMSRRMRDMEGQMGASGALVDKEG